MSKHGIIGTPESPHYRGPDRTHPFQKDGTSSASTIYEARQGGLELLKKLGEQQKPTIDLLTVLKARAQKKQTYLEMLQDWVKQQKANEPADSSPLSKRILHLLEEHVTNSDESFAEKIIDILTSPSPKVISGKLLKRSVRGLNLFLGQDGKRPGNLDNL